MQKYVRIITICLFSLMMIIPLFTTNTEEGAVSVVDGSLLPSKPSINESDYHNKLESYMKSRLGFRNGIASQFAVFNDKLLDELINPNYQYGKDKTVFLKAGNNTEYSDYHKSFVEMLCKMDEYCESRGSDFYFMIYPEKASLYREYLPNGMNYDDTWLDEMEKELDKKGIKYVDCREVLSKEKQTNPPYNKLYDAGHWNAEGAFAGTNALLSRIHSDYPEVKKLNKKDFDVQNIVVNRLIGAYNIINEEIPDYKLKKDIADRTEDYRPEIQYGSMQPYFSYRLNKEAKDSNLPSVLLFHDNMLPQFTVSWTKGSAEVRSFQNIMNLDYYYNIFKPNVVVFEAKENVLNENYFNSAEMNNTSWNPSVLEEYPREDYLLRRDTLLMETEEFLTDAALVVKSGKKIDQVYIDTKLDDVEYAYIISDEKIIDLNKDENGILSASVMSKDFSVETYTVLYTIDKHGARHFARIPVCDLHNIAKKAKKTDLVVADKENDSYAMTTEGDNTFKFVSLQVWDVKKETLLENLCSTTVNVRGKGYYHALKSGKYKLLLRGNSTIKDEYLEYTVSLDKGKVYWYSFNVDSFTNTAITLSKFKFYETTPITPLYYY